MTEIKQSFPFQYEAFSGKPPRPYELVARTLARLDPVNQNEQALEIGCGPANSTIVLLETLPQLRRLICVDPSRGTFEGALELAKYKFGNAKLTPPEDPELAAALAYVEEMRQRAEPFRNKTTFIEGEAGSLPFRAETFDRAICSESLHWLAIKNLTAKPDFDLLLRGTAEISRVLRSNGKLLFNSNGHLFRFGEEKIEGRSIDDMHFTQHPFRREFNKAFAEIAAAEGLNIPVTTEEPSPLHYMFDLKKIKDVLAKSGFRLLPAPDGKDYHFRRIPYRLEDIIKGAVASAKMGHFRQEGLADLPDGEKDRMIEQAKKNALDTLNGAPKNDIYETFVFFAAQKQ